MNPHLRTIPTASGEVVEQLVALVKKETVPLKVTLQDQSDFARCCFIQDLMKETLEGGDC